MSGYWVYPKRVAHSSVVGDSIVLSDEKGRARFMIMLTGTTEGVTKEEGETIMKELSRMLEDGIYMEPR